MEDRFIDFHCHSTLKPYSKSFGRRATNDKGKNDLDDSKKWSIWYKTKVKLFKRALNTVTSLIKFTQADFKSATEGGAKILMISVDPMERELILSKDKTKQRLSGRLIKNLVQGIGQSRINYLYNLHDYFNDMKQNIGYLQQIENQSKVINGKSYTYKVVDSFNDIDLNDNTLYVVPTLEGAHSLRNTRFTGVSTVENQNEVFENIKQLKSDDFVTPFFISLAHHFPNGFCGHAKSLTGIASLAYEQNQNPNIGLLPLGKKAINLLLKNNGEKRIYIDLKHMNLKSRLEFYNLIETQYADQDIPFIVSHGATNYLNMPLQLNSEINFYKEEVIKIALSGGIFGIQLDARRLRKMDYGSKREGIKNNVGRKGLYRRAFYVWRQIEVMALLVYEAKSISQDYKDIDPWGFQVIGSDFDGIVDPLDGFWTYSQMPLLREYLVKRAFTFLSSNRAKLLPNYQELNAVTIVNNFMYHNAIRFLSTYFKR